MKRIMFLYHIKEREYEIIKLIENEIKRSEMHVEIKIEEFCSCIMDVIRFMPDVIVSIPPTGVLASNYLTILKITTGAIIICMSTEGYYISSPKGIKSMTGYNTYPKELVDFYIMWGNKAKKELGRQLLGDNKVTDIRRIKTAGYGLYEQSVVQKRYKENKFYKKIQNWFDAFSKNILVLTGFMVADCSIQEYHVLEYFGNNKPLDEMTPMEIYQAQSSITAEKEFRSKYIDGIIAMAMANPEIGIVVKLHPIEIEAKRNCYDILQGYSNILLVKESVPVGILLERVDGMIHYNSTCNLEAYIHKVPTIQIYSDIETSYNFIWQAKGDSTYLVNINEFQEVGNIIRNDLKYRRIEEVEKVLFGLFNWREGIEYKPIEKIAYYVLNAKDRQRLKYSDEEVIKAINSVNGKHIIEMLETNLWTKLSDNKAVNKELYALFKIYEYVVANKMLHFHIKK